MSDFETMRPEARYGIPAADKVIYNRFYILGYSYYIRQAKWALEIVTPDVIKMDRLDNFRSDYRIPWQFRADLDVYKGSGYDRGHLVASANQGETNLQNSETFLLSNMSPQMPQFNRNIWRKLEAAVRELDRDEDIYETYVVSGPYFNFDEPIKTIRALTGEGVTLPIPHGYFKSVLTEDKRGNLHMWSFMMPNEGSREPLDSFLVPTSRVEQYVGIELWNRLSGLQIEAEKENIRKMWG